MKSALSLRSSRMVLGCFVCSWLGAGAIACRTGLPEDGPAGAGGAPSEPPDGLTGGAGAGVELTCGTNLELSSTVDVDAAGGAPDRPQLVFGSNSGDVVSIFHAWGAADELHATTLEPWGAWPPVAGAHFAVSDTGGSTFAVTNVSFGNVALLKHHVDPDFGEDGLVLFSMLSATSPGGLVGVSLADPNEEPVAAAVVRGYETPPIAFNHGYLASLAMWDTLSSTTGEHALRMAVSIDGAYAIFGGTAQDPSDPDLSCASAPIAAAGARSGQSWLVAAATGAKLKQCGDGASGPPKDLVIDKLVWDIPEVIGWTLERSDSRSGDDPIASIGMAAMNDGAWVLARREGHAAGELVPVDPDGMMGDTIEVSPDDGATMLQAAIAPISNGFVLAYTDSAAPDQIRVELRDRLGGLRSNVDVPSAGRVGSLSILESLAGDAAIIGWMATDASPPRIQLARVSCSEVP